MKKNAKDKSRKKENLTEDMTPSSELRLSPAAQEPADRAEAKPRLPLDAELPIPEEKPDPETTSRRKNPLDCENEELEDLGYTDEGLADREKDRNEGRV